MEMSHLSVWVSLVLALSFGLHFAVAEDRPDLFNAFALHPQESYGRPFALVDKRGNEGTGMLCSCICIDSIIYGVGLLFILKTCLPFILKFFKKDQAPALGETNWKKDTVYLYQFPGNATLTSVSPFCIKVETYLKLHNITYETRYSSTARGTNSRLPYIELNGEHIADSQIILKRLAQKFAITDYSSTSDSVQGHAITSLVDSHTFLSVLFLHHKAGHAGALMRPIVSGLVSPTIADLLVPLARPFMAYNLKNMVSEKFGTFSNEEIDAFIKDDFVYYKMILGEKQFLFGDSVTPADCALFSHLAALYYLSPEDKCYPTELLDSTEFRPLKDYLLRMKAKVFGSTFHM